MLGRKRKSRWDVIEVVNFEEKHSQFLQPVLSDEKRQKYTFKFSFPQEFSFPSNIIYYIARNPSFPNGHLKLISTCKSLFRMSRIIPVEFVLHYSGMGESTKWNACNAVFIDLSNKVFKFWLHDKVQIRNELMPNLASTLVKHTHKFSLREIIVEDQVLTFGELQILVSGGHLESVEFDKNVIKNEDGSVTEFEKVFELLCCKRMSICFPDQEHGISINTANEIIQILSSNKITVKQQIWLKNIPETFDFHSFSEFLKEDITRRRHWFNLDFSDEISEAYKNQLQEFLDEIIQIRRIYACSPFEIFFSDQVIAAPDELRKIQSKAHIEFRRNPNL